MEQRVRAGDGTMALDHEDIRDRFHLELGRMVHAHSLFDFNIGIALDSMGQHIGEDHSNLLVGTIPLANRLKALKPVMLTMYEAAGEEALAEIERWFAKACDLKAIRNDYVHARWGIPGSSDSDDPVLTMLPMTWNFSSDQAAASSKVALSALSKQRADIEELSGQFFKLQKKYAKCAPRARGVGTK
jgi:hypothetical protein